MFDIFYIGENQQLKNQLPFAKQVDSADVASPNTKMFWLIEPNIELSDFGVLEFRPPQHDQHYEHFLHFIFLVLHSYRCIFLNFHLL